MGRILPAVKLDAYSKYDPRGVALTESAFLTAWAGLGAWHEDMVLVGGLVPKYLCGDISASRTLPRPVTLDADIGIALGASIGLYGSLKDHLAAQDFEMVHDKDGTTPRFTRVIGDYRIYIDFLTEHPQGTSGSVIVDTIPASVVPGIARALATPRLMTVQGVDLLGAKQTQTIRVCEVGPFLALKLRAFGSRQQPKDAFDLLYTLRHYDGGTTTAIQAFVEEARLDNPAIPDALRCLQTHFASEDNSGPIRAAHFVYGQRAANEPADIATQRIRVQQDTVDAARLLLESVS
jgi:hypothetical protein